LELAEPLSALGKRQSFTLRVIGGGAITIPGVDVESLPWSAEMKVLANAERDVGIIEEVDLLYWGKQLGWASVYFAGAHALHAEEGTSRQVKAKRLFYSLRSCLLYAFKHFSPFAAMAVLLTTLFVEPVSRSGLPIGRRSWLSFKETWVAYGMLFRWLPDWIFKGTTH
jgi:hypothetical protein